jgi:hypothetical protein
VEATTTTRNAPKRPYLTADPLMGLGVINDIISFGGPPGSGDWTSQLLLTRSLAFNFVPMDGLPAPKYHGERKRRRAATVRHD